MQLLGITGAKGSGKGSVAEFVAEWANQRGLLSVDRGFADKLKWAMARLFWPYISLEDALEWANDFKNDPEGAVVLCALGDENPIKVLSGRELLQHGGTEMGRGIFGDNFWVDQLLPHDEMWFRMFAKIGNSPEMGGEFEIIPEIGTISDLRFENEALRIKDLGGMIWHVDRPGFEPDGHASEKPMPADLVDAIITNHQDIDALKIEVHGWCERLLKERTADESS